MMKAILRFYGDLRLIFTLTFSSYMMLIDGSTTHAQDSSSYEIKAFYYNEQYVQTVQFQKSIGALSIKIFGGDFSNAILTIGKKQYPLYQNQDSEMGLGFKVSNLIIFPPIDVNKVEVVLGNMRGKIEVHGYYHSSNPLPATAQRRMAEDCNEPFSISPDIWRSGLNPPKKMPDSTKVEHIIIHHSATDINSSNITDAVRSIYTYHTVTNGWDDIGYNFLIGPDGTIYQGRDDFQLYDKDNIKGAHYCGKNSNTMGICVLGNFMLYQPTNAALHALELLTAWKLRKENLDVYGNSNHPIGTPGTLPNIAGHRDSCYTKTECPGDSLYIKFSEIRRVTDSLKNICIPTNTFARVEANYIEIFPSPVTDVLTIKSLEYENGFFTVYDLNGNSVYSDKIVMGKAPVSNLFPGIYFIKIHLKNSLLYSRFVKL